ncbi:hypothetical protein LSH36_18g08026 [Paralvinella palmiformis]|uniref:Small integral membrane protein 4 n=1 Tax=Paralvinella palmiformis TaxID=53620 RepID=A0AAD9KBY9_9ANNE|nr:hypothetical protein LSH36_18g08026 [Paralvinella palmiformis]
MAMSLIGTIINNWPGKKRFGLYSFLPVFFVLGGLLEFSMINWTVGETNFYSVYKKKQAKRIAELQLEFEELARQQLESLGKNKS